MVGLYAFPLIPLIQQVLDRVREARLQIILVQAITDVVRGPEHNDAGDFLGTPNARGSPTPGGRRGFPSFLTQAEAIGLVPDRSTC